MNAYMTRISLILAGVALFAAQASAADNAADFFKGKRMTMLVQYSPGGTFDIRARWMARHLPGVTGAKAIVRNLPGGGGVAGYNRLFRLPPDGLTLLTAHTKLVAFDLFKQKGVKYDYDKFGYLGRVIRTNTALLVRKDLPSDIEGLRKLNRIRIGASSPFNEGMIAEMFDLPITIVPGYGGSSERMAAIARGELDATTAAVSTGLRFKDRVNIAFAYAKDKRAPDVPSLAELPAKEPWRSYALSFTDIFGTVVTSPGVSEARQKYLSAALKKITGLEKAQKEAAKMKLVVEWTSPEELQKTLRPFLDLTAETTKQLKHVIERKYVGKLR
ncbi:MAG: tripartite tricarboxylate transporter substrate-binding protein [Deltaproteobacteria bacterium]|nr:tripartite tricarboxylate transporter substrate-binding protein [Deltaproteobacteria bacterium]